jgi:hypothetical protein
MGALRGLPAEGVAEKKNGQSPFFFGARGRLPPLKDFDFDFNFFYFLKIFFYFLIFFLQTFILLVQGRLSPS